MSTSPEESRSPGSAGSPNADIRRAIDRLFRREAGRMVTLLTRMYGFERAAEIEDAIQEAFTAALQRWEAGGVPENPEGWIVQTAKRRLLDIFRREQTFSENLPSIIHTLLGDEPYSTGYDLIYLDGEIRDSQLRMMYACCHPAIAEEMQVALILKTLCAFSVRQIAAAYLAGEEAIAKRLVRARTRLRELDVLIAVPAGSELKPRTGALLRALYLMFSEGYNSASGEQLIRRDMCDEAIRLVRLVSEHPVTGLPETHTLLSLMLFQTSRFNSRIGAAGELLLLPDQDRSLWDRALIAEAMRELDASAAGQEISSYHLEAGIASCHCNSPDFQSTDWARIVVLYDLYARQTNSPVVALNRAIAIGQLRGPAEGLGELLSIPNRTRLEQYYLYHAALGEFFIRLGEPSQAREAIEKALQLTSNPAEKELLKRKLRRTE